MLLLCYNISELDNVNCGKTTYITKEWTTVLTGRFTIDSKGNIL